MSACATEMALLLLHTPLYNWSLRKAKWTSKSDACANFPRSISLNWKSLELRRKSRSESEGEGQKRGWLLSRFFPLFFADLLSSIFCTLVVIEWTVINLKCFCTCDAVCRFATQHTTSVYRSIYLSIYLSVCIAIGAGYIFSVSSRAKP